MNPVAGISSSLTFQGSSVTTSDLASLLRIPQAKLVCRSLKSIVTARFSWRTRNPTTHLERMCEILRATTARRLQREGVLIRAYLTIDAAAPELWFRVGSELVKRLAAREVNIEVSVMAYTQGPGDVRRSSLEIHPRLGCMREILVIAAPPSDRDRATSTDLLLSAALNHWQDTTTVDAVRVCDEPASDQSGFSITCDVLRRVADMKAALELQSRVTRRMLVG